MMSIGSNKCVIDRFGSCKGDAKFSLMHDKAPTSDITSRDRVPSILVCRYIIKQLMIRVYYNYKQVIVIER